MRGRGPRASNRGSGVTLNAIVTAAAAILILIGPLVAVGWAAIVFGADSRPGIGDRDRRPWLWRGPFR